MSNPVRLISETTSKILDLVSEKRMSLDVAIELVDVMKANGFRERHDEFFEAIKIVATKISKGEFND